LPRNQLDLALFLESDRMKALNITQPIWTTSATPSRKSAACAWTTSLTASPGKLFESMAYDSFPYHHSVIGPWKT